MPARVHAIVDIWSGAGGEKNSRLYLGAKMSETADVERDQLHQADGHGRAALVLVESLIHGLSERSLLSVDEAIEIMEVALAAQLELADDARPPSRSMGHAAALLAALVVSLQSEATDKSV